MSTVWSRVRELEGKTLKTGSRGKEFTILSVSNDRVVFVPKDGNGTLRWWPRKEFEELYELRAEKGHLEPSDVRDLWPNDRNTSYIPAIVNELYRA